MSMFLLALRIMPLVISEIKYKVTDTHTSVTVKFGVPRIAMSERIFLNKFSARTYQDTECVSWD